MYEVTTGKALYAIDRWSGVTAGDALIKQAHLARWERTKYLWTVRYIPLALLGAGLTCIGIGAVPRKREVA